MTNIACNLIDTKEFKIQIEELLQNNLIKPSFSPHISSTFLVRNQNEERKKNENLGWLLIIKD